MTVPFIYLAAAPTSATRVKTLTRQEGVRQLLEQPPYTRYSGWNLTTLDHARLVGGRRLSVSNGARKHIDLYEDGTFLAFGRIADFLAWGRNSTTKINSLALIEFAYNFFLVYEQVVSDLDPIPEQLKTAIGLRHAVVGRETPVYLAYGRVDRMDYELDFVTKAAPEDSFDRETFVGVAADEPHIDIGRATYELVVRLYHWFGFPDEAVPYTNVEGTAIDVEQVTSP